MPNRILKESICASENVDALSIEAETFFYRLMVQADDYGRMDARANILRAKCFPLRLDRVTDKDICKWVKELEDADLIETYSVDGHPYLHFVKWDKHQQIRAKRSKYPQPSDADGDLQSNDINGNHVIANVPVIQSNPIQKNPEGAGKKTPARPPHAFRHPALIAFQEAAKSNPDRSQNDTIITAVGDIPENIERWKQTVAAYCLMGWNKRNVAGMLDFFKRGELPRAGKNGSGNSATSELRALGYTDADGNPV